MVWFNKEVIVVTLNLLQIDLCVTTQIVCISHHISCPPISSIYDKLIF